MIRLALALAFALASITSYAATLTSTDIDAGAQAGSTTDLGNGDYTVTAGGSDIWDNSDHFRYLSQSWSGDLDIRVRVDSIGNTNQWSKAGVMLRASTDGNAKHISMFATPGNGFAFQHRDATGAGSSHTSGGANTPPNSWLRLVKRGTLVTGYTSNNGTVWYRVDSATWSGTDPILVGLAVTSHDSNNLVTAELRGYSATVPPGPVNGFISDDINTHLEGATSGVGADGFSVTASGGDIWNNADGFRFVHQTWSGNFDLRAKVESIDFTDYWAKAGVMVRQDTSSGSVHAFMSATSQNGYAFQRRTSANGASDHTWGGDTSYPNSWVRLVRNGNVITGLKSTDGSLWEVVDTLTLSTSDPVEVGLAVTAHNDNLLCKAEFRNVSLTTYTPPVVGSGTGLLAQYFNSADLSSPAAPFNVPVLTRVEADLNNDWTGTSPDLTVSQNNFSARWVGELEPQYSETYTFYLTADDGVRLWIGNTLVVDKWIDQPPTTYTASVPLQAGKKVGIKMEYYQKYGQAVARLKWSSASCPISVVPQSQLSSASGVSVALPATSQVSPAFFEGLAWTLNGSAPSVTANGGNGIFISDNNWFANVALNTDGSPTSTTVTNTAVGGSVQQQITWTATNITGKEDSIDSITIRKGDALLLNASATPNTVVEIDPDGSGYQFSGAPDQKYPFTYNTAGTFIAKARIPAGTGHDVIGTIAITVMDCNLPHAPIADEIGYEREKDVVITPSIAAGNIYFQTVDLVSMKLNVKGQMTSSDGDGVTLLLKAYKRGLCGIVARLKDSHGPILCYKEVDEFQVNIPALDHSLIDSKTSIGGTILTIRPFVENVTFKFNIFAHSSTFSGGVTHLEVNTLDISQQTNLPLFKKVFDTATGEFVGKYHLTLEVPPGEDKYCFNVGAYQSASRMVSVSVISNVNGTICKLTLGGGLFVPTLCSDHPQDTPKWVTKDRYFAFKSDVDDEHQWYMTVFPPDCDADADDTISNSPPLGLLAARSGGCSTVSDVMGHCETKVLQFADGCGSRWPQYDCVRCMTQCFDKDNPWDPTNNVDTGFTPGNYSIDVFACGEPEAILHEDNFFQVARVTVDGYTGDGDSSTRNRIPYIRAAPPYCGDPTIANTFGVPVQITVHGPRGQPINIHVVSGTPDSLRVGEELNYVYNLQYPNGDNCVHLTLTPNNDCYASTVVYLQGLAASEVVDGSIVEVHAEEIRYKCDEYGEIVEDRQWVVADVKKVTVYTLDAHLNMNATKPYTFLERQAPGAPPQAVLTSNPPPLGGEIVTYDVSGEFMPNGIDCTQAEVKDIKIGIVQNVESRTDVLKWLPIDKRFNEGVNQIQAPSSLNASAVVPLSVDSTNATKPLYPFIPGGGPALADPGGCANGAGTTAHTVDTPDSFGQEFLTRNVVGGAVLYQLKQISIDAAFRTWAVEYNTNSKEITPLKERAWTVNANQAGGQKAVVGDETLPTVCPKLDGPNANAAGVLTGPDPGPNIPFNR